MKLALQVEPHAIPAGELVTVPEPLPLFATERVCVSCVKAAVTLRAEDIVTSQLPIPLQAPLQPVKLESGAGVGMSTTT